MKKIYLLLFSLLLTLTAWAGERRTSWTSSPAIEINGPNTPAEDLRVFVQDGKVYVEGTYTSLSIYNILGQEVRNENLAAGVYIVRVITPNTVKTFKVVIS